MTPDPQLFNWWVISITWSIVFLTLASIYIYADSKRTVETKRHAKTKLATLVRDFVFVWILLGLLGLYIVSIDRGSSILFASGNIVVEAVLIGYTVRARTRRPSL
jgi:hypothetical protein